jgi:putative endonuclease
MFFVYILKSEHFDVLYVGQTNDIHARLLRHNNGEVNSTKSKRPWKIVCLVNESRINQFRAIFKIFE